MRNQDMIANAVEASRLSLLRYVAGFDDTTHTRPAVNLPNHCAWNLGHCALTMHRAAEKMDGLPLPASDFIEKASRGDAARFGTESVAFGSTPIADPAAYPSLERCIAIFDAACGRLGTAVRGVSDERLHEEVPWGNMKLPLYLLAMRLVGHNGIHAGQIADLRRAFAMKSIFA